MKGIRADYINRMIDEAMWSGKVKKKWKPPDGFFTKSAEEIASGLKGVSKSAAQAQSRLSFYINRAGDNLSSEDKGRLNHAKEILSKSYQEK